MYFKASAFRPNPLENSTKHMAVSSPSVVHLFSTAQASETQLKTKDIVNKTHCLT